MSGKTIIERLRDSTARIEKTIFMAGALSSDEEFPSDLEEFFNDHDAAEVKAIFGNVPEWVDFENSGSCFKEEAAEWLIGDRVFGYLVNFATPVPNNITDKLSFSYSWGSYYTHWVYAETMNDAVSKGLEWVRTVRAKALEKATKNGGAK